MKLTGVRWDPVKMRKVVTPVARVAAGLVVLASLGLVAARLAEVGRNDVRFLVVPSQLVAERLPRWMPATVRDVIHERVSDLAPLSIFDGRFAERLAEGLRSATPWIEEVREVERLYPNRARVELVLREPVASVDVGDRRVVLDRRGVVLHEESRVAPTRFELPVYPVLGAEATAAPRVGEAFPDPEVVAASLAAGELLSIGEPWASTVREIAPTALEVRCSIRGSVAAPGEVHVRTGSGVLVEWGRARASSRHGEDELPIERKVRHLRRILRNYPGLRGLEEVRLNFHDPYYRTVGGSLEFLRDE
ncbi:MAG: cell division protein FtsQ/DivIB [Planctomycetota bacterium JB042]